MGRAAGIRLGIDLTGLRSLGRSYSTSRHTRNGPPKGATRFRRLR